MRLPRIEKMWLTNGSISSYDEDGDEMQSRDRHQTGQPELK